MTNSVFAIVGSVTFVNPYGEAYARQVIDKAILQLKPVRIVSGGAPGVDTFAKEAADKYDIECTEYKPKNKRWAPKGFAERNMLVARDCTHLLRIHCAASKTYGSGWTADRAEELGVIVRRIPVPTTFQ